MTEGDLTKALESKEKGNECFKKEKYVEAIKCYSEALKSCPKGDTNVAVFLKNRAACYLKLKDYSAALSDCTACLQVSPGDPKALYRRAQGHEGQGNMVDALQDVKQLLVLEPKNKQANEMAHRLTVSIKKKQNVLQSTEGIVGEMLGALRSPDTSPARVTQAVKNCAIVSREAAGAEHLYNAGAVTVLVPFLESTTPEVVQHTLQTLVGLCTGHNVRTHAILQCVTLNKVSSLISSKHSNVASSAVALVKQVLLAVCLQDARPSRNAESAVVISADSAVVTPLVQMLLLLLMSTSVSPEAREHMMETMISISAKSSVFVSVSLKEGVISKLLQLSASVWQEDQDAVLRSDQCRTNIAVALSTLYQHCPEPDKSVIEAECGAYVSSRLSKSDDYAKREAVVAIGTLLQGTLDIGIKIFSEPASLKEVLLMANSDSVSQQSVAVEALALAASNKQQCVEIIKDGLPVLKKLVTSKDDSLKVRALVGLCKLGAAGGSNVNARLFAEGSGIKLEKACRKFLVVNGQHSSLYKWAVEGLAFLTLDAEVKETLVASKSAIEVLCAVPTTGDQSLLYGLATVLVNLTNAYDKREKQPELEELGKYAGENIPKEHELDGEKFVKSRVTCLLSHKVVGALLTLANVDSVGVREQVARVFLALVEEVGNRGQVMQQGGVKALLQIFNSNTTKGRLIAAQALAKIGITNDPKLAFPGQRLLEVVRPFVALLKSEQGLQQFEGLMALTNIASINAESRQRIISEGGVSLMESLMFEEHELIRRAATEALCNMIQIPEVHKRFFCDDVERVKLWTLFSGEEDILLARAASGGLAQLTCDPGLCGKVMEVKSAPAILKELLLSPNEELKNRGTYIVANLMEASQEIASSLVSTDFLEILMGLLQDSNTSSSVRESAARALNKAVAFGLIQPNPELSST